MDHDMSAIPSNVNTKLDTSEVELDEIVAKLNRGSMRAYISVKATATQRRSAQKNATILRVQQKEGRNPIWLGKKVREMIRGLVLEALQNPRKLGAIERRIEEVIAAGIQESWDRHQNPDGTGWKRLTSEAYKAWKERKYPGKGLLEATGQLRRSIRTMFQRVSL